MMGVWNILGTLWRMVAIGQPLGVLNGWQIPQHHWSQWMIFQPALAIAEDMLNPGCYWEWNIWSLTGWSVSDLTTAGCFHNLSQDPLRPLGGDGISPYYQVAVSHLFYLVGSLEPFSFVLIYWVVYHPNWDFVIFFRGLAVVQAPSTYDVA